MMSKIGNWKRNRKKRSLGTAMVETAIVLPVLLLLTAGVAELGLVFARYQLVMGSAREGARIAGLFRINCNPRRVKAEVDRIVMASGNHMGMILLPTNVSVTGACVGTTVEVRVDYDHYFTVLGGLLTSDLTLPISATVMSYNEAA